MQREGGPPAAERIMRWDGPTCLAWYRSWSRRWHRSSTEGSAIESIDSCTRKISLLTSLTFFGAKIPRCSSWTTERRRNTRSSDGERSADAQPDGNGGRWRSLAHCELWGL